MSLRFQISIRIFLFSLCIIILGGSIAIWQARKAVSEEVESSINLLLQLVKLGLSSTLPEETIEMAWIQRLSALNQTRHLHIQLKNPEGQRVNLSGNAESVQQQESPPNWFINLVTVDFPDVEHQIITSDGKPLTLMIQANPLDEITEVWQETIAYFMTLFLLILLTFLAVHLVFNKTLQTIDTIVDTLKLIEVGEYRKKLPDFSTQEYDSIAKAINHLTDVQDRTRQQNQALTQHSLEIQEEERQRLSKELHDEMGQSITAIKVMAATAAKPKADAKKYTDTIIDICEHMMTVVRSMTQQLHPLILTELGLKATLEDLVGHWTERNPGVAISLNCDDVVETLDNHAAIQLYRVVQECLTNSNRHSSANHVAITLETKKGNQLCLAVKDNGKGCQIEGVASGFGLLGMKERIKSLNGRLSIDSSLGEGLCVTVIIPMMTA